jgi:hypothetical protein
METKMDKMKTELAEVPEDRKLSESRNNMETKMDSVMTIRISRSSRRRTYAKVKSNASVKKFIKAVFWNLSARQ